MAELTHTNLPVHLLRDAEKGLVSFVAEVEGALVPLVTVKLGHLEASLAAGLNKDLVPGSQPVAAPPASTPPASG